MKKTCLLLLVLVFFPVVSLAAHDGYIVYISTNNMQYLANINVVIQDFVCIDDRCYVLVKNKSDAVLIVNNGIGTGYEENTITEEPENPVLLANENISTIVGYQWAYNQSTINWQGGYNIAAPHASLRTRVAVIDRGYVTHKNGGLVDCSRVEMRKRIIASGNFLGIGHWEIRDWVAREPHYMSEACDTDIGTDGGHGTSVIGVVTSNQYNLSAYKSASYGRASVHSIRVPYDSYNAFAVLRAVQAVSDSSTPSDKILAVNMSIGTNNSSYKEELRKLGEDKNIIVVVSAGNDKKDLGRISYYPATFGLPNMITVAALTEYNGIADFSNYSGYTDIAAPGTSIRTLHKDTISYRTVDGTSFSAPFITGVLAAGQAVGFNLEPQQLVHLLYNTANRFSNLETQVRNGKVVNVGAFLAAAKACNDDSACRLRVPKTWPERKNMKNMGTPPVPPIPDLNDIDAYPPNWFPPKKLNVFNDGFDIKLTWTHEKYLADHFSATCWRPGDTPFFTTVSADNRSHVIYGLQPGSYFCQVNSIKNGSVAYGEIQSFNLTIPTPTLYASANVSNSSVKLKWSYPQYTIDSFIIGWQRPDGTSKIINDISASQREYDFTNLVPGFHSFTINAIQNGVGWSPAARSYVNLERYHSAVNPITIPVFYESGSDTVFGMPVGYTHIDFYFDVFACEIFMYIDSSEVYSSYSGVSSGTIPVFPGQGVHIIPYSYTNSAYMCGEVSLRGQPATTPDNFNANRTGERSVKVTWAMPSSTPDNYSIGWIRDSIEWGEATVPGNALSYEFTGFLNGIYHFQIASVKNDVYSKYITAPQQIIVPQQITVPEPVPGLTYEFDGCAAQEQITVPTGYYTANYFIYGWSNIQVFRDNVPIDLTGEWVGGGYAGSFPVMPGQEIYLGWTGGDTVHFTLTLTN